MRRTASSGTRESRYRKDICEEFERMGEEMEWPDWERLVFNLVLRDFANEI